MDVPALNAVPIRKRRSGAAPTVGFAGNEFEASSSSAGYALPFWKKLKVAGCGALPSDFPVSSLAFSPTRLNQQFAVAGAHRVEILSLSDYRVLHTFSRFRDTARCIAYRCDGKLLAAGDDSGVLQAIDVNTRSVLRYYKGHEGPVNCCAFSTDKIHLLSGGFDCSLKLWDVSVEKVSILDIKDAHADHITCLVASPLSQYQWISGSADGCVKIWELAAAVGRQRTWADNASEAVTEGWADVNAKRENNAAECHLTEQRAKVDSFCIESLAHGQAVSSLAFFPCATRIVSAGGHYATIWDIKDKQQPRIVKTLQCHLKTVTGVAITGDSKFLVTSSLDQTVKFHSLTNYTVAYCFDFASPVSAFALAPKEYGFAVGLRSGQWIVRRNVTRTGAEMPMDAEGMLLGSALPQQRPQSQYEDSYWHRGRHTKPSNADTAITDTSSAETRKTKVDLLLKTFQYKESLDFAVKAGCAPEIHGLLEELVQRGALDVACRARDEQSTLTILTFILNQLGYAQRGTRRLVELLDTLIAQNQWMMKTSDNKIKSTLQKISSKMSFELSAIGAFRELIGLMDGIRMRQLAATFTKQSATATSIG